MTHPESDRAAARDSAASRDASPPSVRSEFLYRARTWIAIAGAVPLAVVALASAPWFPPGSLLGIALDSVGWLAFAGYLGMRTWATLYIGGRKDRELQTDGPYAFCRNPLYLGSFSLGLAVACFLQRAVFAAGLAGVVALYVFRVIPDEERFLALRFGEAYREYRARTARFWPQLSVPRAGRPLEISGPALRSELARLARATLAVVALHALALARDAHWLPRWFGHF